MARKAKGNCVVIEGSTQGPRVFIDGMEMKGLSTVSFEHNEGDPSLVILAFTPKTFEIEDGLELVFDSMTIDSHSWATWRAEKAKNQS